MTKNLKLTTKDVMEYLGISRNPAGLILNDVRKEYQITIVTQQHLEKYLKL